MYEEGSPEWYRIVAPALDRVAQTNLELERASADAERELNEYQEKILAEAERAKQEREEEADSEPSTEETPNPWTRERAPEYFDFRPEEDEDEVDTSSFKPAPQPTRRPTHRRHVSFDDDEEDLSNRSWMQR